MPRTAILIGPADNGRRMSLADFEHAEVKDGYQYELSRGTITVTDVPNPSHAAQVNAIRRQLSAYDLAHPGAIFGIYSGSECKILVSKLESERHPDLVIYKTPHPSDDSDAWSTWIPEIVIEVVSQSSSARDYGEKRDEYLQFGIQEYWIVDAPKTELLVLRRHRGEWIERTLKASGKYKSPLLPGFELACAPVFQAAKKRH